MRPRRDKKRSVRVGATARKKLKRFRRPTRDWDLAFGLFFALGKSVDISQILLKAARTPNCGPLQTPTTGVKLDLGFLASAGQRTHTSSAKSPKQAKSTAAVAVQERYCSRIYSKNQPRSAHREASHRSGPPHAALTS